MTYSFIEYDIFMVIIVEYNYMYGYYRVIAVCLLLFNICMVIIVEYLYGYYCMNLYFVRMTIQ